MKPSPITSLVDGNNLCLHSLRAAKAPSLHLEKHEAKSEERRFPKMMCSERGYVQTHKRTNVQTYVWCEVLLLVLVFDK